MNKKRRNKNRTTTQKLIATCRLMNAPTCEECGEKGYHWVDTTDFLLGMLFNIQPGFWTCGKFYDADGRRL